MDDLINTMNNLQLNDAFTLTRLLYIKDEVEYMCLISLLSRDLNQTIFWFHEYFYSGYESFVLIYNIYLMFYSWINPQFEKYICKQDYSFENIVKLIINMCNLKYSFEGFILYNLIKNTNYPINNYKGRPPSFLQLFDPKYRLFLHSLYKKDWCNLCAILKNEDVAKHDVELYQVIKLYYETVHNIKFNDLDGFNCFLENELCNNNLKYIIAIILLCEISEEDVNIKPKQIYKTINDEQRNYIFYLSNYTNIQTQYILHYKREYDINPIIGLFNLKRYNVNDLWTILAHNWIYYSSNTPLWNRILSDWDENWSYDHKNKKINMNNIDEFDESFCLYHDEQTKEIQNMCLIDIKPITIKEFCLHFDYSLTFDFPTSNNWTLF